MRKKRDKEENIRREELLRSKCGNELLQILILFGTKLSLVLKMVGAGLLGLTQTQECLALFELYNDN